MKYPILDKLMKRFVSKKLTVFIIACVFLFLDKVSSDDWVFLSIVYVGGQSLIDSIVAIKTKNSNQSYDNEFIG